MWSCLSVLGDLLLSWKVSEKVPSTNQPGDLKCTKRDDWLSSHTD
jgi:hypothetical protein